MTSGKSGAKEHQAQRAANTQAQRPRDTDVAMTENPFQNRLRSIGNRGMQGLLNTGASAKTAQSRPQNANRNEIPSGSPLDASTRQFNERLFGESLSDVRIHTSADAAASARALDARAYTHGHDIVFGEGQYAPGTKPGRELLAHELAHALQSRGGARGDGVGVEPANSAAESEAAHAGRLGRVGLPPGSIRKTISGVALTPTGDAVKPLISYGAADWAVTDAEEASVLRLLRADTALSATITDLNTDGYLSLLIDRVDGAANRFALLRLLGAGLDASARSLVEPYVRALGPAYEMQFNLGRLGVSSTSTPFDRTPYAGLVGSSASAAFSGVGATGVNPTTLDVPTLDEGLLAAGHAGTTAAYSNPIGGLMGYLAMLTPTERMQQAELLINQPISSVDSASYAGNLPSRAAIFRVAGTAFNLEPALIAAFILAEQRDQSSNEDAKDYEAATSYWFQSNTSIGLGQVVISTAQRHDLFQDLLSTHTTAALNHNAVARLLASDEYNIFAAARYIRHIANQGSTTAIAALPNTQAEYPALDMPAFAGNSSAWPDDNIRALGSEYTSRAWDDVLVPAWGEFVLQAYRDIKASGAL